MANLLVALLIVVTIAVAGFGMLAIRWVIREGRESEPVHTQTRQNLSAAYEPTKSGYVMLHGRRPENITTDAYAVPPQLKQQ